ncbi:MAG TPA: hypothetical protein DD671_05170 [Balneolaceae bacterium]|nr:hypothetical protein [Balneolaceae bacterium]
MMNERKVIARIRNAYKKRLTEAVIAGALEEVDMFDKRGNMVLTPDLKVRRKASGYEYTIDHIEGEGEDAVVYLRHPEEPRFSTADAETPLVEKTKLQMKGLTVANMSGGGMSDMPEELSLEKPSDVEKKAPASLLSITKKEFENEYEVE